MVKEVLTHDIPKEWLIEAGLVDFKPQTLSYISDVTSLIRITEIKPPIRGKGNAYFEHHRMMKVLKGFAKDETIPPIVVVKMNNQEQYHYQVYNGCHRFYASLAVGFKFIPVTYDITQF